MGNRPAALIFYANSSEEVYLNKLSGEGKEIQRILTAPSDREYEVSLIPEAGVQNIIDELNRRGDEIEIIHYAGHSNAQKMLLEDNSVQASDFASKLKGHKALKLVFINGCSSYGQVRFFHEAGIPYVIATSRPVEDEKATWVATRFYMYLTANYSVRQAFSEVEIDNRLLKKEIEFSDDRGIESIENESEDTELIWGLYALENAEEYRLALRVSQQSRQEGVTHTKFLHKMICSLKDYKSPINESYQTTIDDIETIGGVSDKTIVSDLLKILPYPLGIRLQQINANPGNNSSDYYRELLYDYTFFFETLLHYTTSIILCQIWQEKPQLAIEHGDMYTLIRTFVSTNRLSQPFETYGNVINAGLELVQELGEEESLSKGRPKITNYLKSEVFQQACTFFDSHKRFYWGKTRLPQEFAIQQCYEAQKHLNTSFAAFGFVIEKNLTSVRDIEVMNFRHVSEKFRNRIAQLVIEGVEAPRIGPGIFPMENKSILYFSYSSYISEKDAESAKSASKSLNLFPFLLDRNVFTQHAATEVDLYLFIGFCTDPMLNDMSIEKLPYPCYYFASLKNPGKIWRFDVDEQNIFNADLAHIDEQKEEQYRQNHLLTNAGELRDYLAAFKIFFLNV